MLGPGMTNTLGIIRSLGEKGMDVHVIMQSKTGKRNYVSYSRYIKKIHYVVKDEDVINILHKEYWNEQGRIAVLCGGDDAVSLIDRNYEELNKRFLVFNCGKKGKLNMYLDKKNQFPIAKKAGLELIATWEVDKVEDIPQDVIFPCLTKGANSTNSTKADMHLCNTHEDLINSLKNGTRYLVQEYIHKEYELNFICISFNQGKTVFVPCVIRKIRDDIGRQSAYFTTDHISSYPHFNQDILGNIAEQLNYEGIFSVEVIYSKGKYYFLEINLRNDGCGYLYTKAGCNYPYLWSQYAAGKLNYSYLSCLKVKVPCTMMGEHDLKNLFQKRVGLITWIRQVLSVDTFYVLNRNDPLPFLLLTWSHIQQAVKRILRKLGKVKKFCLL